MLPPVMLPLNHWRRDSRWGYGHSSACWHCDPGCRHLDMRHNHLHSWGSSTCWLHRNGRARRQEQSGRRWSRSGGGNGSRLRRRRGRCRRMLGSSVSGGPRRGRRRSRKGSATAGRNVRTINRVRGRGRVRHRTFEAPKCTQARTLQALFTRGGTYGDPEKCARCGTPRRAAPRNRTSRRRAQCRNYRSS